MQIDIFRVDSYHSNHLNAVVLIPSLYFGAKRKMEMELHIVAPQPQILLPC